VYSLKPYSTKRSSSSLSLPKLLLILLTLLGLGWVQSVTAQAQSGISSPGAGSTLSGDVAVMGTAVIEPFQKYELHYKLEPSGDDGYIYFDGATTPVVNGQLGVWRASGIAPGVYTLRLRVVKNDGNYAEFFAPNLSVNQGPPPTPTPSEPTPTETPSEPTPTFTPAATPTPSIGQVEQPQLEEPTPTNTPAPVAVAAPNQNSSIQSAAPNSSAGVIVNPGETTVSSATRDLGEALSLDRLREQFFTGMRYSAAIFLAVFLLIGGKRLFSWARRRYG
jgi:hypothetical protein